jgi:CheY-like chemotaxis protein
VRLLILDDDPVRQEHFAAIHRRHERVHVLFSEDAIEALNEGPRFDAALLDHDLGAGCHTGEDVAKHIASMPPERRPLKVIVHSWNPDGAQRMVNILREAGVPAGAMPFRAVLA